MLLVTNRAGELRVAKIYRAKIEPKTEVLQRLGGASFEHVVKLFDHGCSEGRWYELLEYVENGSLEDLTRKEGPKLDANRVGQILVELVKAIEHLHTDNVVHRDIKPSNILVRSLIPFDLVLSDFGIASVLGEGSRRFTSGNRTIAYAAPEAAAGEISKASDWWSLGIMLVEMLTGRHPFAGALPGEMMDDRTIVSRLSQMPVDDLADGTDEPWRTLCRGLLRRDARNRWTAAEIVRWIRRDPAPVADESPPDSLQVVKFFFAGQRYGNLSDIARAFGENWMEARKTLERGHFFNWVKDDLKDNEWRQYLSDLDRDCPDLDERVLRTILKLDPRRPPIFCGYTLDPNGLHSLADEAISGNSEAISALRKIFDRAILSIVAQSTRIDQFKELQDTLSNSAERYQHFCRAIKQAGAPPSVAPSERDLPRPAFLLAALPDGASYVASLSQSASDAATEDARGCAWFRDLIASDSVAALVLIPLVASGAEQETRERRKREDEAAKQRRYDNIYDSCRNATGISAGLLTGIAAGFIPCWIFTAVVGFIGGASSGWGLYWFLMVIFGLGGAGAGQQYAKRHAWLASANRDPNEPLLVGGLAAIVGLIVVGGLAIYWINLAHNDIALAEAKQYSLADQRRLSQLRAQEEQRAFAKEERLRAQEQQRQMALSIVKRAGIARDAFNNFLVDEGSVLPGPKTSLVAWIGYDPNKSNGAKLTMTLVGEGGSLPPCTKTLFNGGAWGSFSNEFQIWCKWMDVGTGDYRVRVQINDQLVRELTAKVLPTLNTSK